MRRKILIADDDPAVRRLMIEVVTGRGRDLVEAEDGEEALRSCMGGTFSLLVLDHLMPGFTGVDVIRHVRKSGDIVPAILLSGSLDNEIALEAGGLGGVECLSKPFGVAELREVVARILARTFSSRDHRLGNLAIRSGVLFSAQVATVLAVQSHEISAGRPARRAGSIGMALGFLDQDHPGDSGSWSDGSRSMTIFS
jgi:CheY-like chemotaxis protein